MENGKTYQVSVSKVGNGFMLWINDPELTDTKLTQLVFESSDKVCEVLKTVFERMMKLCS